MKYIDVAAVAKAKFSKGVKAVGKFASAVGKFFGRRLLTLDLQDVELDAELEAELEAEQEQQMEST